MARCRRKKRYGTLKNAERGRMNLWGADPHADLGDLHVYKCPDCGFYHVGHKSKYRGDKNETGNGNLPNKQSE